MNKDIILYIHNPLDEKLLDRCLQSLLVNQKEDCKWNTLYLYNAGTLIDNDIIIEKLQSIDTKNFFCEDLVVIPFDESTPKSLSGDLEYVSKYWMSVNDQESQVLLLKIDYALSNTFHNVVKKVENNNNFLMTLPVYSCKEWVSEEQFYSLLSRGKFSITGDGIYYRGGDHQGEEGSPFDELKENIMFISYNGSDYNCHYMSSNNLKYFIGGNNKKVSVIDKLNYISVVSNYYQTEECFVAHTWHPVKWHNDNILWTKVEKNLRPDDRKNVVGQRY